MGKFDPEKFKQFLTPINPQESFEQGEENLADNPIVGSAQMSDAMQVAQGEQPTFATKVQEVLEAPIVSPRITEGAEQIAEGGVGEAIAGGVNLLVGAGETLLSPVSKLFAIGTQGLDAIQRGIEQATGLPESDVKLGSVIDKAFEVAAEIPLEGAKILDEGFKEIGISEDVLNLGIEKETAQQLSESIGGASSLLSQLLLAKGFEGARAGISPKQTKLLTDLTARGKVLQTEQFQREGRIPLKEGEVIAEQLKTKPEVKTRESTLTSTQPIVEATLTPEQILDFVKTERQSTLKGKELDTQVAQEFGLDLKHLHKVRNIGQKITFAERKLKREGVESPTNAEILAEAKLTKPQKFEAKTTFGKAQDAINLMREVQAETEFLRSQERAKRFESAQKALEGKTGQEAFIEAKRELGGELPRAEFERPTFTEVETFDLLEAIRTSDLSTAEKVSANEGFMKLVGEKTDIPQRSQIELLEKAWNTKLPKSPSQLRRFGRLAIDVLNIPRSLMSTGEFSSVLRQGLVATVNNPGLAAKNFKASIKSLRNEKFFDALQENIKNDPYRNIGERSGLEITVTARGGRETGFKGTEELFSSEIAEKIPGIGRAVKGFERQHVAYLNKMRMDIFSELARNAEQNGFNMKNNPKVFEDLASIVNWSTGRAKLPGKTLEKIAPALNTVIWSPKNLVAKMQLLNPRNYLPESMGGLSKPARVKLAKDMIRLVSVQTGLLALLNQIGGVSVEADPRSSDFGKTRIGNTRLDMWGSLQQLARFYAQMGIGQTKSLQSGIIRDLSGTKFPFTTRADLTGRFVRSKLSPGVGLIVDILDGQKNIVGEPVELSANEAIKRLSPLYYQDAVDAVNEFGIGGVGIALPGLFGAGVQTFEPKIKTGRTRRTRGRRR